MRLRLILADSDRQRKCVRGIHLAFAFIQSGRGSNSFVNGSRDAFR
jgi:hypothetical protein